jgi:hypothetical protein
MQKLEAAVILMQKSFSDVTILHPKNVSWDNVQKSRPLEPFTEATIDFLNDLSKEINKYPETREYPDVATFAFYCRRANILGLKKQYAEDNTIRLGRGIIYHVAPSNVPVNFAYSLISGMLSGNLNIVRVPSKLFRQVNLIVEAIEEVSKLEKHCKIAERIILLRYDRKNKATSYLSNICDVRIIWGGDETITQIRMNPLPPRAFDVTFADRYSMCVINADKYIYEENKEKIAIGFYNDTYLFDQNACTAPHLVVWTGKKKNVSDSKKQFWNELYKVVVSKKYDVQPVIAVDKLTALYNQAVKGNEITKVESSDNLIWRVEIQGLDQKIEEYRCTSGYFSEYHATNLSEISKIINRKYQTLAYYGFEKSELKKFMLNEKPNGIDRIVPIGRTSDFSLIWDGFNLIESLSRCCEIA